MKDIEDTKQALDLLKEMIKATTQLNIESNKNFDKFFKFVYKIVVAFVICIFLITTCLMYSIFQAYNYDGYPTSEINNNNTNNINTTPQPK